MEFSGRTAFQTLVAVSSCAVLVAALKKVVLEPSLDWEKKHKYFRLPEHIQVELAQDFEYCEKVLDSFLKSISESSTPVIGLDAEWKPHSPSGKNKLALLQLSNGKQVLLIHLIHMKDVPQRLKELLEDDKILKTGVGIINDARSLWQDYNILVKGCVDLQPVAHSYRYTDNGSGLANLASSVLSISIDKNFSIRCSDWERVPLSPRQIHYAAMDAWVSREIFIKIYELHSKDLDVYVFCANYIDKKPPNKDYSTKKPNPSANQPAKIKAYAAPTRKSVLYENCRMLSPEGILLCTCSKKKIDWYLSRDIATLVCEDPPTIQLKFKPGGKGHSDDPFFTTPKQNICVVCGVDKDVVRHSIVPHGYRKFFPETVKSRNSHDIVLLCQKCHDLVSKSNAIMRDKVSREFGVPLEGSGQKFRIDDYLLKVKSGAKTLLTARDKLPAERKAFLEELLKEYYKKSELTEEDIQMASVVETKVENPDFKTHEQLVVEKFKSFADVEVFVKSWRQHFVTNMKPQHLPLHWSVDHPVGNTD